MGDMTAKVSGLEALQARIAMIPVSVREAMAGANKANALEFASTIARIVPIDAGKEEGEHLVNTLAVTPGKTETGTDVSIGGPEAPYPAHLEFGHMDHGKHVPAKPFWYPTLRVLKVRFKRRVQRAANAAIKANAAAGSGGAASGGD